MEMYVFVNIYRYMWGMCIWLILVSLSLTSHFFFFEIGSVHERGA